MFHIEHAWTVARPAAQNSQDLVVADHTPGRVNLQASWRQCARHSGSHFCCWLLVALLSLTSLGMTPVNPLGRLAEMTPENRDETRAWARDQLRQTMEKLARAQADTSAEGALATKYAAGRALNILLLWTGGELALAYRTGATDADLERQAWRPMLEAAPKIFAAQAAVVARWEQKRGEATETQRRVHDPFFKVLPPLEVHASLSERLTLLAKLTGRKALVAEAFDALGPTIGKCKTVDEFMAFPHRLDRAVGVTTAPATREAEPVPASPSEAAAAERVIRRYFGRLGAQGPRCFRRVVCRSATWGSLVQ